MKEDTGGLEEFAVIDHIGFGESKYVLIIEAKHGIPWLGLKQLMLSMKDASDRNTEVGADGKVYGFTTSGDGWHMVSYDGKGFHVSEKFFSVYEGMEQDKAKWLNSFSTIVDCLYAALLP